MSDPARAVPIPMRVYALLYDAGTSRVALNLKDCALPPRLAEYEGKIGLFGGAVEPGESYTQAVRREMAEEVPGFEYDLGEDPPVAEIPNEPFPGRVFLVRTSLAGTRNNRGRIGVLARVCREGDGIVRSVAWALRQPPEDWIHPGLPVALKELIAKVT